MPFMYVERKGSLNAKRAERLHGKATADLAAAFVRMARGYARLTQSELALAIEITVEMLSAMENGRAPITPDVLKDICEVTGTEFTLQLNRLEVEA